MYVTAGLGDETILQKYYLNNVSKVPKIACASTPHVYGFNMLKQDRS